MKINIQLVLSIIVFGAIIYIGGWKLMGNSLVEKNRNVTFVNPIITGHEGEALPNIDLLLEDSTNHINISSIASGEAVVLFYFGPNCPYCQAEMKEIIDNIALLENIEFYLITPYSPSDARVFSEKYQLRKYSNIRVGFDYKYEFLNYFKIQTIPFLAVYDNGRNLKNAFVGRVKSDQIRSFVR